MSEIKPVLRQMIDNNKSHWRPETIRGAHKQLDEYEAKAKLLDRVKEFAEEPPFLLANNENEDYERYAYDQILKLINKYESGDHNV